VACARPTCGPSVAVKIPSDALERDRQRAFDAQQQTKGHGLLGMRERVNLARGMLTIESGERGTTLHALIAAAAAAITDAAKASAAAQNAARGSLRIVGPPGLRCQRAPTRYGPMRAAIRFARDAFALSNVGPRMDDPRAYSHPRASIPLARDPRLALPSATAFNPVWG
jgi:hypothetical protein